MPQGSMLHIPSTNCHLAAKQKPYQKGYLLTKNTEEFLEKKKSGEWASRQKEQKKKTEAEREQCCPLLYALNHNVHDV